MLYLAHTLQEGRSCGHCLAVESTRVAEPRDTPMPLGYDGLRDGMEAGLRPLCLGGPVRRAERMEVGLGGQERSTSGIWPRERQESR